MLDRPDALQRIASAVTPAVMVSACGLIALGLDNQAARMSARLRELAREYRGEARSARRREVVRRQIRSFDRRHQVLTRALMLDYGALLAFVVTSLLELAGGLLPVPPRVPVLVFTAGVAMLGGMAFLAVRATLIARQALAVEREEIEGEAEAPGRREEV